MSSHPIPISPIHSARNPLPPPTSPSLSPRGCPSPLPPPLTPPNHSFGIRPPPTSPRFQPTQTEPPPRGGAPSPRSRAPSPIPSRSPRPHSLLTPPGSFSFSQPAPAAHSPPVAHSSFPPPSSPSRGASPVPSIQIPSSPLPGSLIPPPLVVTEEMKKEMEGEEMERYVAKCIKRYASDKGGKINLLVNDVVAVVAHLDDGLCEVMRCGKLRVVPASHLEKIPAPTGLQTRAIADFDNVEDNFLSLNKGDEVIILSREEGNWWKGYSKGHIGLFPPSCIDMREKDSARGQLDGFGELLLAPSMTLPLALLSKMYSCESMDHPTIEKVTFSIVSLFQNHGTVMSLLYSVSQQEVDQTLSLQTLFRQNSPTSTILKSLTRMFGRAYLNFVLRPILVEVYSSGKTYELDKSRFSKKDKKQSVKANAKNLTSLCSSLLERVVSSLESIPLVFLHIIQMLLLVTSEKFPRSQGVVLSGFFFLRFICPAIVTPHIFGIKLEKDLSPSDRRTLILLSKVIQNLANGVEFGGKEPFMTPMNSFIRASSSTYSQFLNDLSTAEFVNRGSQLEKPPLLSPDDIQQHLQGVRDAVSLLVEPICEFIGDDVVSKDLKTILANHKSATKRQRSQEALLLFLKRPSQRCLDVDLVPQQNGLTQQTLQIPRPFGASASNAMVDQPSERKSSKPRPYSALESVSPRPGPSPRASISPPKRKISSPPVPLPSQPVSPPISPRLSPPLSPPIPPLPPA